MSEANELAERMLSGATLTPEQRERVLDLLVDAIEEALHDVPRRAESPPAPREGPL